jgi:hypothetical protein
MQSNFAMSLESLRVNMSSSGYLKVPAEQSRAILLARDPRALNDFDSFQDSWNDMPRDGYMADGGTYRRRRHITLSAARGSRTHRVEEHQPHFQGLDWNGLNGGISRSYAPFTDAVLGGSTLPNLIGLGLDIFGGLAPYSSWHIEGHQFRIEADGSSAGNPTPEGVHRDGVTFVLMALVNRSNVTGGETTIHDLEKNPIGRFTLTEPLELALVNDERVFHGVSLVHPEQSGREAFRDVLVLTYRHRS